MGVRAAAVCNVENPVFLDLEFPFLFRHNLTLVLRFSQPAGASGAPAVLLFVQFRHLFETVPGPPAVSHGPEGGTHLLPPHSIIRMLLYEDVDVIERFFELVELYEDDNIVKKEKVVNGVIIDGFLEGF